MGSARKSSRPPVARKRHLATEKHPSHTNWVIGKTLWRVAVPPDMKMGQWVQMFITRPSPSQHAAGCDRCQGFRHTQKTVVCSATQGKPTLFTQPDIAYHIWSGLPVGRLQIQSLVLGKKQRRGKVIARLLSE